MSYFPDKVGSDYLISGPMRGIKKLHPMAQNNTQTNKHTDGHHNSMIESAQKGRFSEKMLLDLIFCWDFHLGSDIFCPMVVGVKISRLFRHQIWGMPQEARFFSSFFMKITLIRVGCSKSKSLEAVAWMVKKQWKTLEMFKWGVMPNLKGDSGQNCFLKLTDPFAHMKSLNVSFCL